jgi:hypothetical protein
MATNYTGVPTATQAPGPTPAVGNYPILSLPDDGDALAVASVWQAFKECADFIAFIQQRAGYLLATRYRWVLTDAAPLPSATWSLNDGPGDFRHYLHSGAGTEYLYFAMPLSYGAASREVMSAASVRIYKDTSATTTVTAYTLVTSTGGAPTLTSLATATSTATGEQLITVSGLTAEASASGAFQGAMQPATPLGSRVT